ncbi:Polycomb group RING finger protein 2 [Nymphon striatum]|nr:Polycomb group RING finger protein 2 [Nymphon striatum]
MSTLPVPPAKAAKVKVADINEFITCFLCKGYLIDATTITECLHAFCKSCIIMRLQTSRNCPTCNVLVHKTKPLHNIRADLTRQDIVYKLIPKLYKKEMKVRREFYAKYPHLFGAPSEERGEIENRIIYDVDEKFSLSFEYYTPEMYLMNKLHHINPKLVNGQNEMSSTENDKVEIIYGGETLEEDTKLIDVAYYHGWHKVEPMRLFFRILEVPKIIRRAPIIQPQETIKANEPEISTKKSTAEIKKSAECQQIENNVLPHDQTPKVLKPTEKVPGKVPALKEIQPTPPRTNLPATLPKHASVNREPVSNHHRSGNSHKTSAPPTVAMLISKQKQQQQQQQQAMKSFNVNGNNNRIIEVSKSKSNSNVNNAVTTSKNLKPIMPQPHRILLPAKNVLPGSTNCSSGVKPPAASVKLLPAIHHPVCDSTKTSAKPKSSFQVVEQSNEKTVNASGQPIVTPLKIQRVPEKRSAPATISTEGPPNKMKKTDSKITPKISDATIKPVNSVPISSDTADCAIELPECDRIEVSKNVYSKRSCDTTIDKNKTVSKPTEEMKRVSNNISLSVDSVLASSSSSSISPVNRITSPLQVTVLQSENEKSCLESPSSLVIVSSPEESQTLPASSSSSPVASSITKKEKAKKPTIDEVIKTLQESKNGAATVPPSVKSTSIDAKDNKHSNDQSSAKTDSTPTTSKKEPVKRGPLDLSRKFSNLPVLPAPSRPTMKQNNNVQSLHVSASHSGRVNGHMNEKKAQNFGKTVNNNNVLSTSKSSVVNPNAHDSLNKLPVPSSNGAMKLPISKNKINSPKNPVVNSNSSPKPSVTVTRTPQNQKSPKNVKAKQQYSPVNSVIPRISLLYRVFLLPSLQHLLEPNIRIYNI